MISPIGPFWPGPQGGDVHAGYCNVPEAHFLTSDVILTTEVTRVDGSGLVEKHYLCIGCARAYVADAILP
jgi:hypothetical protein